MLQFMTSGTRQHCWNGPSDDYQLGKVALVLHPVLPGAGELV